MADLGQLGQTLQGLSAGLQGRGVEFNQQLLNQRQHEDEQRRLQTTERLKAFYGDMSRGAQFADRGDWHSLLELTTNRQNDNQTLGVTDTRHSDILQQLAQIAVAGDPETQAQAKARIKDTLNTYMDIGENVLGIIKRPKLTNFQTDMQGRQTAYNPATGQQEVIPSGDSTFSGKGQTININHGSKKEAEVLASGRAEYFNDLRRQALNATEQNAKLRQLKAVDVSTGLGVGTRKSLAKATNLIFGDGIGDRLLDVNVAGVEAYQALAEDMVNSKLNAATGPQTDQDAERIRSTMAGISKEPLANKFLIAAMEETNQRKREQFDFYDRYLKVIQTLDGADSAWLNYKMQTPMIGVVTNRKTGLPMFFSEFMKQAKNDNPGATKDQLISAWRELNDSES